MGGAAALEARKGAECVLERRLVLDAELARSRLDVVHAPLDVAVLRMRDGYPRVRKPAGCRAPFAANLAVAHQHQVLFARLDVREAGKSLGLRIGGDAAQLVVLPVP